MVLWLGARTRRALQPRLLHGRRLGLIQRLLDGLGDAARLQALVGGRAARYNLLGWNLPPVELLEEVDLLVRVRELGEHISLIPQVVD